MKTSEAQEPVILLESSSPICPIQALVEDNGDCVYFYLFGEAGGQRFMRSCWVCNLGAAPEEMDNGALEAGRAPRMPKPCCDHPQGMEVPPELEIVWLEEGDAAALLSAGELLTLIPGWADSTNKFPGYSRHCLEINPLAWPLSAEAESNLRPKVDAGKDWDAYLKSDFWGQLQPQCLAAAENFFGTHERYFGIDGGTFPPKALVTAQKGTTRYAATLGVCLFPMPKTEVNPEETNGPARRAELAFAWEAGSLGADEMPMLSYLSGISNIPWQSITFLGPGHTIPCQNIPGFAAVLLHSLGAEEQLKFPEFRGDPVITLWLIPITQEEYDLAVAEGSHTLLAKGAAPDQQEWVTFTGEAKFLRKE